MLSGLFHHIGARRLFLATSLGLLGVAVVPLMLPNSAYAANNMSVNSRLAYGNATNYCGGGGVKGMVWLSNDGSNYYSETVSVGATATSVSVQVRGAVNTCSFSYAGSKEGYANMVNATYAAGVASTSGALSISGSSFFRGNVPSDTTKAWSTVGKSLTATLNVSGIAPCTAATSGGTATGTITVGIYRYLEVTQTWTGGGPQTTPGGAGTESVTVPVSRSCPVMSYSLRAGSYVSTDNTTFSAAGATISAYPGQTVYFRHNVDNTGDIPATFGEQLRYTYNGTLTFNATQTVTIAKGTNTVQYQYPKDPSTAYTIPSNAPVGTLYCQGVGTTRTSSSNSAPLLSTPACAQVTYNYDLTPSIGGMPSSAAPGKEVNYTATVTNGGSTVSGSANWSVVTFTLTPGEGIPNIDPTTGSGSLASVYGSYGAKQIESGAQVFGANLSTKVVDNGSVMPNSLAPGSQVCFAAAVQPYNQSTTDWRYSQPSCTVIAKTPYVDISGGDLMVGRGDTPSPTATISVNRTTISGQTYGSWTEFGAFAPVTSDIASGGNLATTALQMGPSQSGNSGQPLTFANDNTAMTKGCPSIDGCFGSTMGMRPDLTTQYSAVPSGYTKETTGATIDLTGLAAGKYFYPPSSSVKISGTLAAGVSVIVSSQSTIEVTGNITYADGPYTSLAAIPQLILATTGNIQIDDTVTTVNAWLSANGTISTCDAVQAPASYTSGLGVGTLCDQSALAVVGPVSANSLQLRRTYGADTTEGGLAQPSEVFDLRPDADLWAYAQGSSSQTLTTAYTVELPPRF